MGAFVKGVKGVLGRGCLQDCRRAFYSCGGKARRATGAGAAASQAVREAFSADEAISAGVLWPGLGSGGWGWARVPSGPLVQRPASRAARGTHAVCRAGVRRRTGARAESARRWGDARAKGRTQAQVLGVIISWGQLRQCVGTGVWKKAARGMKSRRAKKLGKGSGIEARRKGKQQGEGRGEERSLARGMLSRVHSFIDRRAARALALCLGRPLPTGQRRAASSLARSVSLQGCAELVGWVGLRGMAQCCRSGACCLSGAAAASGGARPQGARAAGAQKRAGRHQSVSHTIQSSAEQEPCLDDSCCAAAACCAAGAAPSPSPHGANSADRPRSPDGCSARLVAGPRPSPREGAEARAGACAGGAACCCCSATKPPASSCVSAASEVGQGMYCGQVPAGQSSGTPGRSVGGAGVGAAERKAGPRAAPPPGV